MRLADHLDKGFSLDPGAPCLTTDGETRTYADLARALGSAPRAVGQACGDNPIPILIPCHRVVAANGALGGYSGAEGPATKRLLLDLERRARTPTAAHGDPVFPPQQRTLLP